MFFAPGRHIDEFRRRAEAAGRPCPISVTMGLDPAIRIGATSEAPTTPPGYDEPAIAGGPHGTPVRQPRAARARHQRQDDLRRDRTVPARRHVRARPVRRRRPPAVRARAGPAVPVTPRPPSRPANHRHVEARCSFQREIISIRAC
ncbi:UbiD family decarboxylase domain-containing protein [Actinoallomurus iriomotensis]|uniref:UbiD family decarboxylase domain-containing protein n=1 Tax=Actinoallomurus iriomotensis TaxID=478107 RepID=UPI003D7F2392